MTAQLKKLEQLLAQDDGGLPGQPFLPVIVTRGHEWYLLAATRSKRETVCSTLHNIVSSVSQCTDPLGKDTSRLNTECAKGISNNCRLAGTGMMVRRGLPAMVQSACDWSSLVGCKINTPLPIAS